MNAVVKPLDEKQKTFNVLVNQGVVSGRLGARRSVSMKEGKRFLQLLTTPAPDPYSMPSVVELKSVSSLGADGDDWSGVVRIAGYPNNYDVTSKADGEISQVRSARVVLEVVES